MPFPGSILFGDARPGLRLYSLSTSAAYVSGGLPGYSTPDVNANSFAFAPDTLMTGSFTIGFTKPGRKSKFSVMYTPTYRASRRYSDFNGWNHSLAIGINRPIQLAPRLTLDFGVSGNVIDFRQFVFAPNSAAGISLDSLNPTPASGATGAAPEPVSQLVGLNPLADPGKGVFYGTRFATYVGQGIMSYSYSRRLNISFGGGLARTQMLAHGGTDASGARFEIPHTSAVQANLTMDYSLSRATNLGLNASTNRTLSSFQDAYISSFRGYVSRRFARRWFTTLQTGIGLISPVRQSVSQPKGPQWINSGMLGLRLGQHGFAASVDRSAGDAYGIGAGSVLTASGSWRWQPRSRNWALFASFGEERMRHSAVTDLTGWRASGGLGRRLGEGVNLQIQQSYFTYTGMLLNKLYSFQVHAAMLSIVWAPGAMHVH